MDVLDRNDLPFPQSLPEFQGLFPDDRACAAYMEKARWGAGFTVMEYLQNHNADPKPFIWTKSKGEILEKVARAKQALESHNTRR